MDEVGHDQSDGETLSGDQGACGQVGLAVELPHPLQHALAGLLADVGMAAKDFLLDKR
jgi:hypothetical protein